MFGFDADILYTVEVYMRKLFTRLKIDKPFKAATYPYHRGFGYKWALEADEDVRSAWQANWLRVST